MARLPPTLEPGVDSLAKLYRIISLIINGKIEFGDGVSLNNIAGSWINVVTPPAPNTDFVVTHLLGHLPSGYLVMQKSASVDVYTGSVAADNKTLTLRATVGNVTIRLFVF